ncbi:MAG: hypothetical protein EBR02_10550 [Alphaproteobacteria bacterium]|nr:hypothetical protein [Alphaproteobacteria bacterium]
MYSRLYASPFAASGETQVGTLDSALAGAKGALVASNVELPEGILRAEATFPRADTLAKLAATCGAQLDIGMHPFYLRAPDAKLPVA